VAAGIAGAGAFAGAKDAASIENLHFPNPDYNL